MSCSENTNSAPGDPLEALGDAEAAAAFRRLVRHLRASGFVLMKRPDLAAPSTTEHIPR